LEETNCLKRQVATLGAAERVVRIQIKASGEGKRMDRIGDNSRRQDNKKMAYLL
jgi:hypothetical protein